MLSKSYIAKEWYSENVMLRKSKILKERYSERIFRKSDITGVEYSQMTPETGVQC